MNRKMSKSIDNREKEKENISNMNTTHIYSENLISIDIKFILYIFRSLESTLIGLQGNFLIRTKKNKIYAGKDHNVIKIHNNNEDANLTKLWK